MPSMRVHIHAVRRWEKDARRNIGRNGSRGFVG